jgi:Isochorismatase family
MGKNAVGIGEKPEGGAGPLLIRGSMSWSIVKEVEPIAGEIIVDKAGKGAALVSDFFMILQKLGATHLILCGITTDVCVHTIMRQANDLGYWCLLLKDSTGATDMGNHNADQNAGWCVRLGVRHRMPVQGIERGKESVYAHPPWVEMITQALASSFSTCSAFSSQALCISQLCGM